MRHIYKINLLEAMVMAREAWESVSPATLKNSWNHANIQCLQLPKIMLRCPHPSMLVNLAAGWDISTQFATKKWSLPEVHAHLQKHLGNHYISSEWNESLDSVLRAGDDPGAALAALAALCKKWAPDPPLAHVKQLRPLVSVARLRESSWTCSIERLEVHL